MEHHSVESMLIASFLWVRIEVPDDRMSDEYNYDDDDDELDFALRSASLQMNEIERSFFSSNRFNLEEERRRRSSCKDTIYFSHGIPSHNSFLL